MEDLRVARLENFKLFQDISVVRNIIFYYRQYQAYLQVMR